jgi:hypothetical protein
MNLQFKIQTTKIPRYFYTTEYIYRVNRIMKNIVLLGALLILLIDESLYSFNKILNFNNPI